MCCVSRVHLSYSLYEKSMVVEPEEASSVMLQSSKCFLAVLRHIFLTQNANHSGGSV